MTSSANINQLTAQEYEEYDEGYSGYEETAYSPSESYEEEWPQAPPPPPGAKKKPKKGKKKPAKKAVKKGKKVKKGAKKKKVKKGKKAPVRRPPPPPSRSPPPPPQYQPDYYGGAAYTEPAYGQEEYPEYTTDEYFPVQEPGIVISEQAMIETVVEEEEPQKKDYQRLTDDPIYSIEEKIDRMLMGKELSLEERFQRKFGEKLEMGDAKPSTSYTKREMAEEAEPSGKGKKTVPKAPIKKDKKAKSDGKDKKAKKKAKGDSDKGGGFLGGLFGGKKEKKDKKDEINPFDLMRKPKPAAKPKPVKEPEPVEEEEEIEQDGVELTINEFRTFKEVVDELLENLPEDILNTFTNSNDYNLYERVADSEDFTNDDMDYIKVVDDLLDKLPKEVVDTFTESKDFELYLKVVDWGSE